MKSFLSLLFCFCCALRSNGQNLVPNPSFEEHINCPQTLNDYEFTYWDSFNRTPDYFNTCSSISGFSNPAGFQIAHSGNAYAGFITFVDEPPLWREHLGVPLIVPLQVGQTYYVSFYVSRGFEQPAHDMASNKIGALFSTIAYDDTLNPSPVLNFAHVYEDSIITDTTNWVHLHWNFVADSAYHYLIIGNFFDDSQTDTLRPDPEF